MAVDFGIFWKNTNFRKTDSYGYILGQLLEIIRLIFIASSGRTACICNSEFSENAENISINSFSHLLQLTIGR